MKAVTLSCKGQRSGYGSDLGSAGFQGLGKACEMLSLRAHNSGYDHLWNDTRWILLGCGGDLM